MFSLNVSIVFLHFIQFHATFCKFNGRSDFLDFQLWNSLVVIIIGAIHGIYKIITFFYHLLLSSISSSETFEKIIVSMSNIFIKDINLKIFEPTVSNILIMVWLFVYCYYGNLISWKSEQVADFAYNSHFYKYPLDLRIFTLFMIHRSQRPFIITGYKITRCSLESYGRVRIFSPNFMF